MREHAVAVGGRAEAEPRREIERHPRSDGDRFPVRQRAAVARQALQRVAECVAQIEQGAAPGLAFVLGDEARLGLAAGGDGADALGPRAVQRGAGVRLEPVEEGGVVDQRVFHAFGVSGGQFARREGVQRIDVGQHAARLQERADEVLAQARVDAGLAAHRTVDLREQRGGYLRELDAAQNQRGRDSREIADNAAAERDDGGRALHARGEQRLDQAAERLPRLACLARRNDAFKDREPRRLQARAQRRQIERRDVVVGHHRRAAPGENRREQFPRPRDKAGADDDVVAAPAQGDAHTAPGAHCAARAAPAARARSAAATFSTVASMGRSAAVTVMSASA